MTISRRDFLKATSIALGTLALPSWIYSANLTSVPMPEVDKNNLADAALALAKKLGATYADIRINKYRLETISTRERQVQNVSRAQNFGFGVRVLVKGTWGFAASPILTPEEVERVTREADASQHHWTRGAARSHERLTKDRAIAIDEIARFAVPPADDAEATTKVRLNAGRLPRRHYAHGERDRNHP